VGIEGALEARMSGRAIQKLLGACLIVEPRILMGFGTRYRRDALYEIEDAFGLAAFFGKDGLDDLGGFGFTEAAFLQKLGAIIIGPRDDPFARSLNTVDERHGRGIGKTCQRRSGFVGEALCRIFGVADRNFLEVFDTPKIAVLADGPEIKAGNPEGLGSNFGIPAIEAAEVEIGRAVR
jgi:hypothetical protein